MSNDLRSVRDYMGTIEKELLAGNATEHTHRPALKALIEGLALGVIATNEPQRTEWGTPDFAVTKSDDYRLLSVLWLGIVAISRTSLVPDPHCCFQFHYGAIKSHPGYPRP